MSSSVPMVKSLGWISVLPHMAVAMGSVSVAWLLGFSHFILIGALAYLVLSFTLKITLSGDHRRGIYELRSKQFAEAIPWFRKSFEFFESHPWIDHYRYLTLLSSSKISYREMALVNQAFCHSQLGEGNAARALYEETLRLFPSSGIAEAALKMMDAVRDSAEPDTESTS